MRTGSVTFREAIFSQQTEEVFILLIEISHPTLPDDIRVCSGGRNITIGENLYVYYPFDITLPDDIAENVSRAKLIISNISRDLISAIRGMASSPIINVKMVLASDPTVTEIAFEGFKLVTVDYNALTITGDISVEDFLTEPVQGDSFVPSQFPGLF
jgi:hypothetical protein